MTSVSVGPIAEVIRNAARPLTGAVDDFLPLLDRIGNARVVLIGEASHGTHEFYRVRADITQQLIRAKGFTVVAVEADWPDAYRVNRYVRLAGADADAEEALQSFRRYPQWMWRNADMLDFVGWLRAHNESQPDDSRRAGFYGLDLYSLHTSMNAVIRYLRTVDPDAARRAELRYGCFDRFATDPQEYGYQSTIGLSPSCEQEAVAQLVDLRRAAGEDARRDGRLAADDQFFAEQNARVVTNAERYYRAMFAGRAESWNLRDRHMAETLSLLLDHLDEQGGPPKVVVWAHNSHLGDARATEMGDHGEVNVGQLVREKYEADAVLVGFSTYTGTVTATSNWDEPAQRMTVRPALRGSYEALFHDVALGSFYLDLDSSNDATAALNEPRLERAIGVIYRPDMERTSHYFRSQLPVQFDALLHYDVTRAVEPLERTGEWDDAEVPETFPSAL